MIHFHFCRKFINEIKDKDFKDYVCNKIMENEHRNELKNVGNISCFTGSIYVLKTTNPKTRTIIEEQNVEINKTKIRVYFVREIVSGKNFDFLYGKIIFPQLKNGEWIKNNSLPDEELNNFINESQNKQNSKIKKIESPPQELIDWLKEFQINPKNEIFESEDWVKYTLNSSSLKKMPDKYVNTFRLLLLEIINDSQEREEEIIKQDNGIQIIKSIKYSVGIVYSKIAIEANNFVYFLFNGAHLPTQTEYWDETVNNISNTKIDFDNNIENISRKAFRSYPIWTVSKDELWFTIQKSNELSNLSLTREQLDFFRQFKFPYYINGQAGSGKSTMLYYLFANAFYFKCLDEIPGDILFLTENETLLELSKNSVFDLLSNNPEFDGLTPDKINNSKNYFNSFKQFLFGLLSEHDKQYFPEDKYLDFSKFKQLYEESYLVDKNKFSAEESWFTIITYIKGFDLDKNITSENYSDIIPRGAQIIPKEKFSGIVEKVLPFYEKLIKEENFWDKLKIIRFISQNLNIKQKYTLIICDEAQDFCRVELRFILRLSKYLNYDLSKVDEVPIIFAGDQNQTVNPTGFRQSDITSMMYEELHEIAKFNYDNAKNIYNPSYNYRSVQPVVSLANFVQYHRTKNLGIKNVKPQNAKRPSSSLTENYNIFLNYDSINQNTELKQDLIDKLKYKIFIVPVNTQEKDNYISKHEILSIIDKVEVKTSVEAKGAEYEQVVLYGFGEYFLENFAYFLDGKPEIHELFERAFFYNKLYVGLTRAQTELLIIDSVESKSLFWEKLINKVDISIQDWKPLIPIKEKTILYNPDSIQSIIKSTPEDALKNAQKDKEQGLFDKNPARLKVAANQFFKISNFKEYYECLALSEELKENWKQAAEYYLNPIFKNLKDEQAASCYFKGRCFTDLLKTSKNLKSIDQSIRIIIARFINGEKLLGKDIEILKENHEKLSTILNKIDWRNDIIEQFILAANKIEIIEQKKDIVYVMENLAKSNDENLWKEIGNIRFELKQYLKAIEAWTTIDFFENNEKYYISQIEVSKEKNDFVNTVLWLECLLKFKDNNKKNEIYTEIKEIYFQHINGNFCFDYYSIVFKALIIIEPYNKEVIEIAKKIEVANIEIKIIIKFYQKIIEEESLNHVIFNFIIERWAKCFWKMDSRPKTLKELNEQYLKFTKIKNAYYKAFDGIELNNISEFPQEIRWFPQEQLSCITIQNFRKFKKVELSNLGKFNLIVGDNNVGKTSLLEALLFSSNYEKYITNLALAYIHRIKAPRYKQHNSSEKYLIPEKSLVNDFIKNGANPPIINFNLQEGRHFWNYTIQKTVQSDLNSNMIGSIPTFINENISITSDNNINNKHIDVFKIIDNISPLDEIKSPLIPFGKGFDKDLAIIYYENIEKIKENRNSFLESMRVFIPKIERIITDTENGNIDIEELDFQTAAPLHQYGEGANKLFRILVQITLQKGGKLLVDEIDAGIHYSHFPSFWKTILNAAYKYDVQIFATTHNLECIKHFANVLLEDKFSEYQDISRILTIRELADKNIAAVTRIFSEFEYELDNEFEIRGGDL